MLDEIDMQVSCFDIGMGGNCGLDCPVLERGDCETEDEMLGNEEKEDKFVDFDRAMRGI